ncbi:MAG: hypothetical protein HGA35_06700 [Erysipelotrichaceae bacterium]|nr:hypothetical protein [Erysipelotrichaceae bacterium]
MKDTCLNCGKEVEIKFINIDELGNHSICPDCGSSFDISAEIMPQRNTEGLTLRGRFNQYGCDVNTDFVKHKSIGIMGHIGHEDMFLETAKAMSRLGHDPVVLISNGKRIEVAREYEQEFNQYMFGDRLLMSMYSEYSRKKTIPDQLKELGVNSFAKLKAEWVLIKNKESKHNRVLRDAIIKAYEIVTTPKS